MSKKDTFSSGSPDKGPGMWCKAVKSAIIISLMMFVGEIYAFQSSDLLSQYRHMNSSVIQYIDVEEKRENSYLVSLNVKEMRLADILETLTRQMKVGLSYDSEADLSHPVSIKADNAAFFDVLNQLIEGTGLEYLVSPNKNTLVIRSGREETEELQQTVTGRVTDAQTGEALPGVNVVLVGSEEATGNIIGTQSNLDGDYSINVPEGLEILAFTYIGYQRLEVEIGGRTEIDIQLQQDIQMLDDVVVVGYGVQRQETLTGSVTSIPTTEFTQNHVGQTGAALQGLAPGVTVTQRSGQPGVDGGSIRIRGVGTLGDSNPLIIVDGVESSLNNVNPDEIESLSILKDAASASIYGSRAANGVIVITTKRGIDGLSLSYRGSTGWQKPTELPSIVNAVDHMLMINEAYVSVGSSPLYSEELIETYRRESPSDRYPDTDWQSLTLLDSAFLHDHSIGINAGGENMRTYASLSYSDHGGIIDNTDFKRYSLRVNSDIDITNKLSTSLDIYLRHTVTNQPSNGAGYVFHWMRRIPANQAGLLSNGTYGEGWNGDHPLARARDGGLNTVESFDGILNLNLKYSVTDWLVAEVKYAPKYYEPHAKQFYNITQTYQYDGTPSFSIPSRTSLTERFTREWTNNILTTLNLDKEVFKRHQLAVLLGFQQEDHRNNWISAYRDDFVLPEYTEINAGSRNNEQAQGSASHWALRSLFGRINYNIDDKYLFEVNARYDGSSRFSEDNRYSFFPSFSVGWNISRENFFQDLSDVIQMLKLRASWGRLGNQNIGLYPYASFINVGGSNYVFNNSIASGASLNNLANPDIRWETTESVGLGVDINLLGNLNITADYFHRETRDILLQLDIPRSLGLNPPYQNAGIVENKGWEIDLSYNNYINDFSYAVMFNLSDVQNKIVDMRGISRTGRTADREGYPIGSFYGFEAIGLFQTENEINEHATQFGDVRPGDIKYRDINGDGVINDDDRVVLGSPIPRWTYGVNINLGYRAFDLALFIQGVGKASGFIFGQGIQPFYEGGTVHEQHKDRWTPDNPEATFPRLAFNQVNNIQNSSFWMRDASYLRLKNLQIGYNVPPHLIGDVKRLRIYAAGRNLFTFHNFWEGYDPEAPISDGGWYPQMRTFSLGIDIQF